VRAMGEAVHMFKIPLLPVPLPLSHNGNGGGGNAVPAPLPQAINMPREGAIGVAVDGVPIWSNFNTNGNYEASSCSQVRHRIHMARPCSLRLQPTCTPPATLQLQAVAALQPHVLNTCASIEVCEWSSSCRVVLLALELLARRIPATPHMR
jgi:hypothetical protein